MNHNYTLCYTANYTASLLLDKCSSVEEVEDLINNATKDRIIAEAEDILENRLSGEPLNSRPQIKPSQIATLTSVIENFITFYEIKNIRDLIEVFPALVQEEITPRVESNVEEYFPLVDTIALLKKPYLKVTKDTLFTLLRHLQPLWQTQLLLQETFLELVQLTSKQHKQVCFMDKRLKGFFTNLKKLGESRGIILKALAKTPFRGYLQKHVLHSLIFALKEEDFCVEVLEKSLMILEPHEVAILLEFKQSKFYAKFNKQLYIVYDKLKPESRILVSNLSNGDYLIL